MNKPALYTKANDPQRRHVKQISDEFTEEIGQMSGRCLDIGSGPGDALIDFILPKLNKEASLVCSDISEEMVKFAKEKYMDNDRLSFIKLDIESSNLPEDLVEQFDHLTSFFCINWCRDMRQAFKNIFNLLQPGGNALLMFVANSPCLDAYKELAAMPRYQPYMKDFDRHVPVFQHSHRAHKNLKALLKGLGFEVHHCSIRKQTYTFHNLDDLSKFALAVNPFVDRIPANLLEKYKRDLARGFAEQNIILSKNSEDKDDYSILYIYTTLIVYLKKPTI